MNKDTVPFSIGKSKKHPGKWAVLKNGNETGHNNFATYEQSVSRAQAMNRAWAKRKKGRNNG